MMAIPSPDADRGEERRIEEAYARRDAPSRYSLLNSGQLFMVQERERCTLALLKRHGMTPLRERTVLEVGSGLGNWLRDFVKWGASPHNVVGIDLLPDRVEQAKALCPPGVTLRCSSMVQLDFPDDSFDIVLQATVFTSILDSQFRCRAAAEMLRVVKSGGLILWYDFHRSNPRNRDVRGVTRSEISTLFPGCDIDLRRLTLAPPIARAIAPRSWLACSLLTYIPALCTHYLGAIRKR